MDNEVLEVLKSIKAILEMFLFLKMIGIGIKCFDYFFGHSLF